MINQSWSLHMYVILFGHEVAGLNLILIVKVAYNFGSALFEYAVLRGEPCMT